MFTVDNKERRVGLVMRQFAGSPDKVEGSVNKLVAAITKALSFKNKEGEQLIDRIDIVIPTDSHYKQCDCGKLKPALDLALNDALSYADRSRVVVTEVPEGDNNVGVLNAALRLQLNAHIGFMIVNSPSAAGYLTQGTALAMCEAWNDGDDTYEGDERTREGAWVVGVVLPETPHPTLAEMGIVQNTLAGWDVWQLSYAGGFDKMAAIAPKDAPENPNAGVEEVPVLLSMGENLVDAHIIAFVEPQGEFERWQLPAEGTEDRANHDKQHATKISRAEAHAKALGVELSMLEKRVIPGYRYAVAV